MNELYHHGIKGMKWGVRRYQNYDGSLTPAGKRRHDSGHPSNEQEMSNRKTALKNRRTMSDSELKQRIERLKMEHTFKTLTETDIAPGKKCVSEILSSSGKKVATMAAAGAMAYAVRVAMTKEFNAKEAANYIAANPNKK